MEVNDLLIILSTATGGFFLLMALLFFLRQNAAVQRFKQMLFSSPWLWMLQDISVLGQCLLASLSLYELIPSGAVCSPYSGHYFFSNVNNGSTPVAIQYPLGTEIQTQCQPVVPALESSREVLLGVIVASQITFATAILLRATGIGRRYATLLYCFVCASAAMLAVAKIATVVFIIIKTRVYDLQFSCDDTSLHACENKALHYDISYLPGFSGCLQNAASSPTHIFCSVDFDCNAVCSYPNFNAEVYLLMFNFLLSFFYIVYLMTEYFSGRAHLSLFQEFQDPAETHISLEQYQEIRANRYAYRNVRNISAASKMVMALGSIAFIIYSQGSLTECSEFACSGSQGRRIVTSESDVSFQCGPTLDNSSAVYQFLFASSAMLCIGLFILGNQLALKGHFATHNKPIIATVALLQVGSVLMLMWCIALLTQGRLSFKQEVKGVSSHNHVESYSGYTFTQQFNSTSDGCPAGDDGGKCEDFCKIVVPSSLTYLLGILAMSVGFMGLSLFEYRQMALMKLRASAQAERKCTADSIESTAACAGDLKTPLRQSDDRPS